MSHYAELLNLGVQVIFAISMLSLVLRIRNRLDRLNTRLTFVESQVYHLNPRRIQARPERTAFEDGVERE